MKRINSPQIALGVIWRSSKPRGGTRTTVFYIQKHNHWCNNTCLIWQFDHLLSDRVVISYLLAITIIQSEANNERFRRSATLEGCLCKWNAHFPAFDISKGNNQGFPDLLTKTFTNRAKNMSKNTPNCTKLGGQSTKPTILRPNLHWKYCNFVNGLIGWVDKQNNINHGLCQQ